MILVVGGAGYIGSHMVRLLNKEGEDLLVLDDLSSGHVAALRGAPFVRRDLNDREQLSATFAEYPIDVVMHFAARISVGESVREPLKYWRNNVAGVLNLLEAMGAAGCGKLVFSSTAAVFGEPQYVPIDEDHPKKPTSPYGTTKLAVETMLKDCDRAHGLKSVAFRYFNAAGAAPGAEIGEDHDPEEHLIPVAIRAAQGLRPKLSIFGTDYDTPDGTCVRDYVHVEDLAKAHLMAIRHLRGGGDTRQYNLGTGAGYSVRQVIDVVGEVTGIAVPHEEGPRRPGDPARLVACSDRIEREWGWKRERSDLRTIVADAWAWHSAHPAGYGGSA